MRWESDDAGYACPVQALTNEGEVDIYCSYWYFDLNNKKVLHEDNIHWIVINDLIEIERYRIVAPSVGNPMSTTELFLQSNCGNQIMYNPIGTQNASQNIQVSATLFNSFSPGYLIQASGDAPVKIQTSALGNLSFKLVDSNLHPIKLMNPLYLTLTVAPIEQDPIADVSTMKLPKDKPTTEQAKQQEAEEKAKAEADAKVQAEAKAKEDMKTQAFQFMVQYLGPILAQQQAAVQQQQAKAQKQQDMMTLLQTPEVLQQLEQLPKNEMEPYLDQLQQQMEQQRQAEAEQQAKEEEEQPEQPAEPAPPEIHPLMWNADNVDRTI
jgi:hypothetical protein